MSLSIKSVTEQTTYGNKLLPQGIQARQEWFIEFVGKGSTGLEGIGTRLEVEKLVGLRQDLPSIREIRPGYPRQYCVEAGLDQHNEVPNVWRFTASWQTITNLAEAVKDPTKRPVLIDTGTYKYQKVPTVDLNGKAVVTTAGELIRYTQTKAAPVYTFTKNVAEYPTYIGKDRDFVNKDTVAFLGMTFKPWELYVPEVSVSHLQYESEYPFYELVFTMYANIDDHGWRTRLRNAGFHELRPSGKGHRKVKVPQYDSNGNYTGFKYVYKGEYRYVAIQMGTKGRYSYPSSEVVLTPEGEAYREFTAFDKTLLKDPDVPKKDKPTNGSGPVIGLQGNDWPVDAQGITQKQFDAAVVELEFLNAINFNDYFPLK